MCIFHSWTKWTLPEKIIISTFTSPGLGKIDSHGYRQIRYCKKCGKVVVRKVTLDKGY